MTRPAQQDARSAAAQALVATLDRQRGFQDNALHFLGVVVPRRAVDELAGLFQPVDDVWAENGFNEDRAAINRFGFNNEGMEAIAARLAQRPRDMVLGLNLLGDGLRDAADPYGTHK
mgnify:CR=1 FL=1